MIVKNESTLKLYTKESFRQKFPYMPYDVRQLDPLFASGMSAEDIHATISLCLNIRGILEKTRPHTKDQDSSDRVKPYRLFRKLSKGSISISEKNFNSVYNSLNGIRLDIEENKPDSRSSSAAAALAACGIPKDELGTCLYELYVSHSPELIEYNHPVYGSEPGAVRSAAEAALKRLGQNTDRWLDALCILSVDPRSTDTPLENTYVYYSFTSHLQDFQGTPKSACIIEPEPSFVRKWVSDPFVRDIPSSIYLSDPSEVIFLQTILGRAEKMKIRNTRELGGDLRSGTPDVILMFCSHILDQSFKAEMIETAISHSRTDHTLMIMDTDHAITSEHSLLHEAIKKTKIHRIDLLPDGITYLRSPKRKMLLTAEFGYVKESEDSIHITSLKLVNKASYQMLSSKITKVIITDKEYLECRSLRKIFSDEEYRNNLKTDKTRHKKLRFSYSDEILFTYSVRDKDGSSVINVNPYIIDPKGKRIPLPELNTEKAPLTINDPEVWLGTFFAHKVKKKKGGSRISIRGEISEKLKEVYSGHPVTMKTFIYVHTEIERDYSDEKISLVRALMESSLSEMYPRDITARHIKAYLEEYDGCRQMMLTVLTDIFNIAMKSGHLHRDPAAEISSSLADRYKELDEVRTALTKQFLSVSEIRSLTVKCLTQAPDDPLYLAVLLRIFTGLSPSVICTIRYGDIRKAVFRGTDFQILSLERRLSSSGNVFTPLSRPEQIRDIPLPESVTALIKQRETMLRIKYPGITDDQVGRMQIFDGGDIRIDASTSILSPSKISNLTRTLLRSLDIKSNTLHIPHNKYGIEDTDLSRYGGDLLRSTYRHYLVRETDLNEGEINYLLGIIPLSIDYRNYVDCGERNIRKQYRFFCAQRKLSELFGMEEISNE